MILLPSRWLNLRRDLRNNGELGLLVDPVGSLKDLNRTSLRDLPEFHSEIVPAGNSTVVCHWASIA